MGDYKSLYNDKEEIKEEKSLADLLKLEFGEVINEGPAYEYSKYIKDIEKKNE